MRKITMKQGYERFDLTQADRLTKFVDQVLEGKMKQTESNVDDELLGLILRLARLFAIAMNFVCGLGGSGGRQALH